MNAGALVETVIGAIVLAGAVFFLIFAQGRIDSGPGADGYELSARFSSVGDLERGADVRVAGVPVGTVRRIELDPDTFFARATLVIDGAIEIPADSTASITANGLLGGLYVNIEPGGDVESLQPGAEIEFTQGAVDLFDLVGQFVSNSAGPSE